MESSEAADRRLNRIAGHLAANLRNACTSSLASMVCSSSSGMQSSSRKDGRMLFARQDSSHLPAYARDLSDCQGSNTDVIFRGHGRRENRLMFARQASHTQAPFMREYSDHQKLSLPMQKEGMLFKQASSVVKDPQNSEMVTSKAKDGENNLVDSTMGPPLFARIASDEGDNRGSVEPALNVLPAIDAIAKPRGQSWHPRMDIAESRVSYVVTIELPGVQIDNIRVEVNPERLRVSGLRSPEFWMDCTEKNESTFYHRKEVARGPFEAQWLLPKHIILDNVSAEFLDGFLRVLLPKIAA